MAATVLHVGRISWRQALRLQANLNANYRTPLLILCEHPHTYTAGRRVAFTAEEEARLRRTGADVVESDRGGLVTYHGPGQLMGYLIMDCRRHGGVRCFVHHMQQSLIGACAHFGLQAAAATEHTGIWIGDAKIAAIGLEVKHGISMHGFALNVKPDLSFFQHIVPCGIPDKTVTSLAKQLQRDVSMREVITATLAAFRQGMALTYSAEPSDDVLERIWQASPFARPVVEGSVEEVRVLVAEANTQPLPEPKPTCPAK